MKIQNWKYSKEKFNLKHLHKTPDTFGHVTSSTKLGGEIQIT